MVKVLGHRGLRSHPEIDENSAAAFEAGLKAADGIETDAVVSADGTVFLGHDVTQKYAPHAFSRSVYVFKDLLDKKSAVIVGERRIEQLSDSEIDQLRLKKGAKVPRLAELFNQVAKHPGKTINIEVKGEKVIEPLIAEINKAVAAGQITKDQIVLTSFNHPAIQKARELAPDIRCGLIFSGSSHYDSRIFPWSGNKDSRYVEFNKGSLKSKLINEIAPEFFVLKASEVTEKNISLLREHFPKAKVMFWTSAEKLPEQNSQIVETLSNPKIAPAIEAVITDYPEQMVKLLQAKGLRV